MRLEVFDQSGQRVFDSNIKRTNLLDWNVKDRQRQAPTETIYTCIITVIDISGHIAYKAGIISLEQSDVLLQQLDKSRLSSGQLQALEARLQSQSNVEGSSDLVILKAGEITQSGSNIGISTSSPASKPHVGVAPSASANFGTLSLGGGAFDGSTSGFFAGSSGTSVAVNEASGYSGNLIDLQVAGTRKLAVNAAGSLGVQGTAPDSNVGVKLSRTGSLASSTGTAIAKKAEIFRM